MKKQLISFIATTITMISVAAFTLTVSAAAEKPLTDADVTAESMYVHTGNEDADKVFNTYVDTAVKMLELGVDNYDQNYYGDDTRFLATFCKECDGTEEQRDILLQHSDMERFLWTNCYTSLVGDMNNHPEYFETWESLIYYYADAKDATIRYRLNRIGADEVTIKEQMDAYEQILKYQFDYYTEHHTLYCFFTGKEYSLLGDNDYSSYFEDAPAVTTSESSKNDDKETHTSIVSTQTVTAATTTVTTAPAVEKGGVWSGFLKTLKGTWFTLSLLAVFLIGLAVVVIIKKKKGL